MCALKSECRKQVKFELLASLVRLSARVCVFVYVCALAHGLGVSECEREQAIQHAQKRMDTCGANVCVLSVSFCVCVGCMLSATSGRSVHVHVCVCV